ncbi:MAG: hypothetical protein V4622_08420 [Bacteroidota bacterium]
MKNKADFFKKLLLIWMGLICLNSYSQTQASSKIKSKEWQSLFNNDLVNINYRYSECNLIQDAINKEEYYLQIQNLSNETLTLSWDLELIYGDKCFNCYGENDELKFELTLNPNESIEGSCGERNQYKLNIFSKFLDGKSQAKLSDFNIKNLTFKNLKL